MKKQTIIATGVTAFALLQGFAEDAKTAEAPAAKEAKAPSQEELQKMIAEAMTKQQAAPPAPTMTLEEAKSFFSHGVGVNIGSQINADKEMIDQELFIKGLNEGLEGKVKAEELDPQKMQEAQRVIETARSEKSRSENEAFIAENKGKEGVKTTESGLQYKVITAGEGASPTPEDQVEVHYTGKLIDGTVFDSSVERGKPVTFGVTQVIPGWVEGLQLMKPGSKYEFFIPWNLAYGERGSRNIGPYSALVFEVELLNIVKPAPPEEKPAEKK